MRQLAWPTLLCHRLNVDNQGMIGYELRQRDPKRMLLELNSFHPVLAAGDSYNDITMLEEADADFFFAPRKCGRRISSIAIDYQLC